MARRKKKEESNIPITDNIEDLKSALEADEIEEVTEFISTGSTLLDYAISNKAKGGVPVGRITELIGNNQAGKTLLATHILANTQKMGGIGVCIDVEHDVDKQFSLRIGVDWDSLIYKEYLESIEDIAEYIEKVIKVTRLAHRDKLITIVWDSIAAAKAGKEIEGVFDPDKYLGLHARLMSAGLRRIRPMIKSERIALVCTNQVRQKINAGVFGDPTTTAHGTAMSFYSSLRIKLTRTAKLEQGKDVIGAMCQAKIIKNKCAPAWRTVDFPIMYEYGIDDEMSIFDYLADQKIITGAAWRELELPGRLEPLKFRRQDWSKMLREDEELKNYAYRMIDKHMTMVLNRRPEDLNIDIDSILEVQLSSGRGNYYLIVI